MYGPEREKPCPGCTHALDGVVRHVPQRTPVYIVAQTPIARLAAWAHKRGRNQLSMLSTAGNCYDGDYFGDTSKLSEAMRRKRSYE